MFNIYNKNSFAHIYLSVDYTFEFKFNCKFTNNPQQFHLWSHNQKLSLKLSVFFYPCLYKTSYKLRSVKESPNICISTSKLTDSIKGGELFHLQITLLCFYCHATVSISHVGIAPAAHG